MAAEILKLATAQFPVHRNITRNLCNMISLLKKARDAGAEVIHFPEAALSGYAGVDITDWSEVDWKMLKKVEQELQHAAGKYGLGMVYGVNRQISATDIRNSLIYVDRQGRRRACYDKRFCTTQDLAFYKPGNQFATFQINGFKCGLLICYDLRFPEVYREYKKRGVDVIFQSFYNARRDGRNIHTEIMRPIIQTRVACNYMYISASNASGFHQSWPSVFVLPNGIIAASCRSHRTGMILREISSSDKYYDASGPFRDQAMQGILHS